MAYIWMPCAKALEIRRFEEPMDLVDCDHFRAGHNRFWLLENGLIEPVAYIGDRSKNNWLYRLTDVGKRAWRDLRDWCPPHPRYPNSVRVVLS